MSRLSLPQSPKSTVRRKFHVQEIVQNLDTNKTIIKNFSFENFYDNSKDGNLTNYQSSSCLNVNIVDGLHPEVPMDVDTSNVVTSTSDTSNAKVPLVIRKRRKRKDEGVVLPKLVVKANKVYFGGLTKILILVLFFIIGVSYYFCTSDKVLEIDQLKLELEKNVLSQDDAITTIVNNFERKHLWLKKSKILPLVGGTGVGKTLTANILKKFFLPELVHEINGNQLTNVHQQQSVVSQLNSCCCNLIVIDDLSMSDTIHLFNFIQKLPVQNHSLVILPIFNIQNTRLGLNSEIDANHFQLIKKSFEESGLHYEFVLFYSINSDVVKKWIKQELLKRNVREDKHTYVIESLINDRYVQFNGFKGVNAKLALAIADL